MPHVHIYISPVNNIDVPTHLWQSHTPRATSSYKESTDWRGVIEKLHAWKMEDLVKLYGIILCKFHFHLDNETTWFKQFTKVPTSYGHCATVTEKHKIHSNGNNHLTSLLAQKGKKWPPTPRCGIPLKHATHLGESWDEEHELRCGDPLPHASAFYSRNGQEDFIFI